MPKFSYSELQAIHYKLMYTSYAVNICATTVTLIKSVYKFTQQNSFENRNVTSHMMQNE